MPEKKKNKRGLLGNAWDFLSSAGAGVLGSVGDLEYAIRNPTETLTGIGSLFDPHLKTSSLQKLAEIPVQDSGTFFPTSDELTSAIGGNPYSLAGLAGGIFGIPKVGKLAKLSALERLKKLGLEPSLLQKAEKAAEKGAGIPSMEFGRNYFPIPEAEVAQSIERGKRWLWGGEQNSLLKNPRLMRFDAESIYAPNEKAPQVVLEPAKKSVWLRGMDWDEAAKAAEKGLHIDVKNVSKQLGFDGPVGAEIFQKIRNGLANILEYGKKIVREHPTNFYPEARDVINAAVGGDPEKARQMAIVAGATSPQTSVTGSLVKAFGILSDTDASIEDPNRYLRTAGGKNISSLVNAKQRGANFSPMSSPKVGSFTNELDPTIGGLLSASKIFNGTVNDSHMYTLVMMIAHDVLKVDNASGALVIDIPKFNEVKRNIAKNLLSPKNYEKFKEKLAKNPNAVPILNNVPDAMHKYLDGEFALLSRNLDLKDANTGQAIGWAVKQIVDELSTKKALTPKKALEIANAFSNTFANAWRNATGVLPHESLYSDKLSTLAETMRKFPQEEANKFAANLAQGIPAMLREGGIVAPEAMFEPRAGIFEGKKSPVFPFPIGVPKEAGHGMQFLEDISPQMQALGIISGQSAEAPAFTLLQGKGSYRFKNNLSQQEVFDLYDKLGGVTENEKPISRDIVDRGIFGTILTNFDEANQVLPSKKLLEKVTKQKVSKIGYKSNYVEGIKNPVTGTGEHTRELLSLLSSSPQTEKMVSSKAAQQFAQNQLNALQEGKSKYGLSEGLGPEFDINIAHKNLLQLIAQERDGKKLSDLIQAALKAGIPLPVLIMILERKGETK